MKTNANVVWIGSLYYFYIFKPHSYAGKLRNFYIFKFSQKLASLNIK